MGGRGRARESDAAITICWCTFRSCFSTCDLLSLFRLGRTPTTYKARRHKDVHKTEELGLVCDVYRDGSGSHHVDCHSDLSLGRLIYGEYTSVGNKKIRQNRVPSGGHLSLQNITTVSLILSFPQTQKIRCIISILTDFSNNLQLKVPNRAALP